MKAAGWAVIAALGTVLAGCGGGGGGGGPTPPTLGTFKAATDRTTAQSGFSANLTGANASRTTIQIYGDERNGTATSYTASKRLTISLYGTVVNGASFPVTVNHNDGTASVVYLETTQSGGVYTTTGLWNGTGGVVTISAVNGSRVQGTFTANTVNTTNANVIHWTSGQFNVAFETPPPPF